MGFDVATTSALEHLIPQIAASDESARQHLVDRFLGILTHRYSQTDKGHKIEALFSVGRAEQDRAFIGAAFIRLLAYSPAALEDKPWAWRVWEICDCTYERLYRDRRLSVKAQNFEKERALIDAFHSAIGVLSAQTERPKLLEKVLEAKTDYLKAVNSSPVKSLILPFLPADATDVRQLRELFDSIHAYADADAVDKIEAYQSATATLRNYCNALSSLSLHYADQFFVSYFGGYLNLIDEDFRSDDSLKNANLSIAPADRKYPLRTPNNEFAIGFVITNHGPGVALNVSLTVESTLQITHQTVWIPKVAGGTHSVSVPARTGSEFEGVFGTATLQWHSAGGEAHTERLEFELQPQPENVAWGQIFPESIYSIEPVTDEQQLIGRHELLEELTSRFSVSKVPSYLIHGQKRVGKTSVVKSLRSILKKRNPDYIIVYTEGGDFRAVDGAASISALGETIVSEILSEVPQPSASPPHFNGSLAPLGPFLTHLTRLNPALRFLFLIDEFDALPTELYKRGPIGDTLFLNLRSLSNKENVGFVLVGSERMDAIQNQQGEHINKWETRKLDYFDRDKDWEDFISLVRRPAAAWMEFSDSAIDAIYEYSAGNPFFTNIICRSIAENAIERRDAYIGRDEVIAAIQRASRKEPVNRFAHFWDDGILETGEKKEEISLRRRRILVAVADIMRSTAADARAVLLESDILRALGRPVIEKEIYDFERRGIILAHPQGIEFKVKLFAEWLRHTGVRAILIDLDDEDEVLARRKWEESLRVQSGEIESVSRNWIYQGRRIELEAVRRWLDQFPSLEQQRLMFTLLQKMRFYTQDVVRSKMHDVYNILRRRYETDENRFVTKRRDFIVTYLDDPAKSGALMAKYFAEENRLFDGSVVPPGDLRSTLLKRTDVKVVIAIDDFVGTGGTLKKLVKEVWSQTSDVLDSHKIHLHVLAISGFRESKSDVESYCAQNHIDCEVSLCDILDNTDRAFHERSEIFPDVDDRKKAERLCHQIGAQIERRAPLGYGGSQAIVVFEHNCPNNTLPIFWAGSRVFSPLFPRV